MSDFMKTEGNNCPNYDNVCPCPGYGPVYSPCPGPGPGPCPDNDYSCPGPGPGPGPGWQCPGYGWQCPGFGTSELAQYGCPGFIGAPVNGSRKNFSTLFLVILILLLFPSFFNNNGGFF